MAPSSPPVPLPDRYRDATRIAAGGMATVYAAQDTLLGRRVAVKLLHAHVALEDDARERFAREARAAARVSDHPHVATIYDVGEAEELPFIVMEHFSGGTLGARLRNGPVDRELALSWLTEAASALDHAHRHGIVHRDVKPGNLLLDSRDRLAISDFGIARMATDASELTQSGIVLGTAAYLSPEQVSGAPATASSDLYSLAVVAFQLLTGEKPFPAGHLAAQALAHASSHPPAASSIAPELPVAVDHVLWRGLEKDPTRRWRSAGAFVCALQDAVEPTARTEVRRSGAAAAGPAGIGSAGAGAATAPLRPPRRPGAEPSVPPRAPRRWMPAAVLAAVVLIAGAAVAAFALGGGSNGDQVAAETTTHGQSAASRSRTTTTRKKSTDAPKTTATPAATTPPATATTPPATTTTPPATATQTTPQTPTGSPRQLQAQGHQLIAAGDAAGAIPVLQAAVANCPVSTTDPCAYAFYDLGHALRLAGRPAEAIPVLLQRLQNPDQRGAVAAELKAAQGAAGGASNGQQTRFQAQAQGGKSRGHGGWRHGND
jgi:tRNA A-37 threonylcarbamoyl transferase component Bud32